MMLTLFALSACRMGAAAQGGSAAPAEWEPTYTAYQLAMQSGDVAAVLPRIVHVNGVSDEQLYPIVKRYARETAALMDHDQPATITRITVERDDTFVTVIDRVTGPAG